VTAAGVPAKQKEKFSLYGCKNTNYLDQPLRSLRKESEGSQNRPSCMGRKNIATWGRKSSHPAQLKARDLIKFPTVLKKRHEMIKTQSAKKNLTRLQQKNSVGLVRI
jgi:hypothetical protein